MQDGEDLLSGVIREIFEETKIALNKDRVHFLGRVYIRVGEFDFQYCMFDYLDQIENPGDVKIDFSEHKGFTWVNPRDALKMPLITDEDTCFRITFGL